MDVLNPVFTVWWRRFVQALLCWVPYLLCCPHRMEATLAAITQQLLSWCYRAGRLVYLRVGAPNPEELSLFLQFFEAGLRGQPPPGPVGEPFDLWREDEQP